MHKTHLRKECLDANSSYHSGATTLRLILLAPSMSLFGAMLLILKCQSPTA